MRGPASPVVEAFARQVGWCTKLASPFTAKLLERSRVRIAADAALEALLRRAVPQPGDGLVALRWAAAFHDLALQGEPPWAPLFAAGADAPDADFDAAIDTLLLTQTGLLSRYLASPPQTNEVQRSAVLLPALLLVAARTGLPLSLLELGASGGLNGWADRWCYDFGGWAWGDSTAPLTLRADWRGVRPPADAPLRVVGRRACDLAPIDLRDPAQQRRLAAYVWSDQRERLLRLQAALAAVARWQADDAVVVERAGASEFAAAVLARRPAGVTTVCFHSLVWQYLDPAEQAALRGVIEAAGAVATADAPLAWLSLEHPAGAPLPEVRLRLWPGGADELLALAHPHGAWVDWAVAA